MHNHIHLAKQRFSLESATKILTCFFGGAVVSVLSPIELGTAGSILLSMAVTKVAPAGAGHLNKLSMPWWDWVKSYWRKPVPVIDLTWHHQNPRILDVLRTEVTENLQCGITYDMV